MGDAPAEPVTPAAASRPAPRWLVALAAVLAVVVVGLGAYALTHATSDQGGGAAQQTSAGKSTGTKKTTSTNGTTKENAGKSGESAKSGTDGSDVGTKPDASGKDGGSGSGAASDDAAYVVRAEGYQFTLPSYWRGKVDVVVDEDEVEIYPKGYAPTDDDDRDDDRLVTLELEDGADPYNAGDIGNFLAYSQTLGNRHVEVWTTNWPWLVATGSAGSAGASSTDESRTLVDLSTGGTMSYDEALARGGDDEAVSNATRNYLGSIPWDIKAVGANA